MHPPPCDGVRAHDIVVQCRLGAPLNQNIFFILSYLLDVSVFESTPQSTHGHFLSDEIPVSQIRGVSRMIGAKEEIQGNLTLRFGCLRTLMLIG